MQIKEFMKAHEEANGREFDGKNMHRHATDNFPKLRMRSDVGVRIAGMDYSSSFDEEAPLMQMFLVLTSNSADAYLRMAEVEMPLDYLELVPEPEIDYRARYEQAARLYNTWRETHEGIAGMDDALLADNEQLDVEIFTARDDKLRGKA